MIPNNKPSDPKPAVTIMPSSQQGESGASSTTPASTVSLRDDLLARMYEDVDESGKIKPIPRETKKMTIFQFYENCDNQNGADELHAKFPTLASNNPDDWALEDVDGGFEFLLAKGLIWGGHILT